MLMTYLDLRNVNARIRVEFVLLRYRGKRNSDKLTAALSSKLRQASSTVREQLSWKSASPDQVEYILVDIRSISRVHSLKKCMSLYFEQDIVSRIEAYWKLRKVPKS